MRITHVVATTALVALAATGCGSDSDDAAKSPTGAVASESPTPSATTATTTKSGTTRSSGERHTGTVKSFNPAKGYGFIEDEVTRRDVFVHFKDLSSVTLAPRMREGQRVTFVVVEGDKGLQATDVQLD